MAIIFRVIFITIGIVLVERFGWLLYIFGALLVYTGIKMFSANHEEEVDLEKNKIYVWLRKVIRVTHEDGNGKYTMIKDGKKYYTSMFVVVVMLATTDIVFALDSIPAVFGISTNRMVILRSLFFLLRGAVDKFSHLQQGIAIVLIFIGLKMLVEIFDVHIPIFISLLVILVCIGASMIYSVSVASREEDKKIEEPPIGKDLH
jgi:tellurite resistance protein TerC